MPNINRDINFCREYLHFCESMQVHELNDRYIALSVQMYNRRHVPITTFYLGDFTCDLESVFRHYYKNYVKHT